MKIAPSILSADFSKLGEEIRSIEQFSDYLHVDVMDGHFVPNITIGSCVVESIRKISKLPFDVHLMISEPEKYIEDFVNAGADFITFHSETVEKPLALIHFIHKFGKKAGISIKPGTDIDVVLPYVKDLDLVLVMSVEPGFGGQRFLPSALEKIKVLDGARKMNKAKKLLIEVDGGINAETGKLCKDAGADILVAGSYIFKAADRKKAIENLR